MALSGLHVTCAYTGGVGSNKLENVQLLGRIVWSETMATGDTTSNTAPAYKNDVGHPIFEVYASADVYVAIGADPDATNGPRAFVPATTVVDFLVQPGDKLAWIIA